MMVGTNPGETLDMPILIRSCASAWVFAKAKTNSEASAEENLIAREIRYLWFMFRAPGLLKLA
jgi:hypothetical protein